MSVPCAEVSAYVENQPLFISSPSDDHSTIKGEKNMTSISAIYNQYINQIPAGKRDWGYSVVVLPAFGAYWKANSSNGAKSAVLPGGFVTKPGVNLTTGVRRNAFLGSTNIAILKDGKLYKRAANDIQFNFRLTSLTGTLLTETLKGFCPDEEINNSTDSDLVDMFQSLIISQRGQIHIVCQDVNQSKVVAPTKDSRSLGELEEFIVHPQNVFRICFVPETAPEYIHRVDMPEIVNSRNLGKEIDAKDAPEVVDALAPRALNRKQVIKAVEALIKADPEFCRTASLEEIQTRVGSTKKEVEELIVEFRIQAPTDGEQTDAAEAGNAAGGKVIPVQQTSAAEAGMQTVADLLVEQGF